MNKKYIYIGIGIFFIITIVGISVFIYYDNSSITIPKNSECFDCGEGRWEKMDLECESSIFAKEAFVSCLTHFDLYPLEINVGEMTRGYIEIDGYGLLDNPSKNSIEVFKFHQWAVDEEGNMYLEGQLG